MNLDEIIQKPEYDFNQMSSLTSFKGLNSELRINTLSDMLVSPRIHNARPQSSHQKQHVNINELTNLKAELKSRARRFLKKAKEERLRSPLEGHFKKDKP